MSSALAKLVNPSFYAQSAKNFVSRAHDYYHPLIRQGRYVTRWLWIFQRSHPLFSWKDQIFEKQASSSHAFPFRFQLQCYTSLAHDGLHFGHHVLHELHLS